jgi:hypothetical protein
VTLSDHTLVSDEAIAVVKAKGINYVVKRFLFNQMEDVVQHTPSGRARARARSAIIIE